VFEMAKTKEQEAYDGYSKLVNYYQFALMYEKNSKDEKQFRKAVHTILKVLKRRGIVK